MAFTQAPILKYAFAEKGDRLEIPTDKDPQGEVNWEQGYTPQYALNPELDGKYIQRDNFNFILYTLSQGLKDAQINGGRLWSQNDANLIGGYPAGARVMVWQDLSTNQLSTDPVKDAQGFYMARPLTLISMVENNLINPLSEGALFKEWFVEDGNNLFDLKIHTQTPTASFFKTPAGYLDLGDSQVATKTYLYDDYPRVKYFKERSQLPTYIQENDAQTFKFVDLRGRFFRMFSNGGEVDSGRAFNNLQGDAMRNITGEGHLLASGYSTGFSNEIYKGIFYGINYNQPTFYLQSSSRPERNGTPSILADASRLQIPTANEIRPFNFNIKLYIKL